MQIMEHAAAGQLPCIAANCTAVVFEVGFEMLTPVLQAAAAQPEDTDETLGVWWWGSIRINIQ